jgi:PKD repeat protein
VLVLAAVCAHASSLSITPTTTLSAETGNNTSTASSWTASSNGNLGASNISKVDHHTLLYPGATTPIYSHMVLWFGPSNHIQVGYRSDDYSQVRKQVDDHVSRGLDGAIIDWYGTSHTVDTTAAIYMMQYAESLAGYPFKFAMMEDKGALLNCAHTSGCDLNAQLVTDLSYIINTFAVSPTYITQGGRPVILFFGIEDYAIDWNYVKSAVPGNPLFVFENAGAFDRTNSDGGFAWVQINTSNTNDWKQSYLDYFYQYANNYPQKHTFGAVYKGFNDTAASWSLNRIMSQQCGQVWLNTWNEVAKYHSASNQLEAMEIVTWNDYEEGTAIEPGIDNCLSLSATISGSTLSWAVSGNENTLDHYTVFISTDGENLMSLADVAPGLHLLDLSQYGLGSGNYSLYVKAVGKPSILNHMSSVASLTVGQPPTVVLNVTPQSGLAGSPVSVSTADSSDPDDAVVASRIDFGDGSVANGFSASHTYATGGTYTVSATVTDAHGAQSVSTTTVTIADFSLNITRQNGTITASTPASFVVSVTPVPQLDESVALACSGLPAGYSCTFSPAVLTPGSGVATTSLTVSASGSTVAKAGWWPILLLSSPMLGFITLGGVTASRRCLRKNRIGCLLLMLLALVSCGGGNPSQTSGGGSPPVVTAPGGSSNSVTFTVIAAAGTLQRSAPASVVLP